MAKAQAQFSRNADYRLLDGYLRKGRQAGDFDSFAAALARAKYRLTEDEKLDLAATACDLGKAGHAYLLVKAGAPKGRLHVRVVMPILPDEDFMRLRRDAYDAATGHITFDEIMQRHAPAANPAFDMARGLDLIQRFPARYGAAEKTVTSTKKNETKNVKPQRP